VNVILSEAKNLANPESATARFFVASLLRMTTGRIEEPAEQAERMQAEARA
jgi:hypothetical protein